MKKFICILMICALVVAPMFTLSVSAADELKELVSGKNGVLMNGASFHNDAVRGSVLHLNNDDIMTPGQGLGYDAEGQHAVLADYHLPNSDNMTISVWFYSKDVRNWARVIDIGDADYDNPQRFINISPFPNSGEYTCGTININDGGGRDRVFADTCNDGEWVHAVLVINANSGNPNTLYVNGVPFQSTKGNMGDDPEPSTLSPKDIHEAAMGLGDSYLGRSRYGFNADNIFNGYIDDVAIFDVALTADQVAALATADFKAGVPAAGAVPYGNMIALYNMETAAPPPPAVEEAAPAPAPEAAPAPAAVTPAPAPVASVPVPQTSDCGIVMTVLLMAVALLGSAIFVYVKKNRSY